jgi:DNA topoisomerase-1
MRFPLSEPLWNLPLPREFGKQALESNTKMPVSVSQPFRRLVRSAKLHHVPRDHLTVRRQRTEEGYIYHAADGSQVTDKASLERFASLAVPPAYEDVFFSPDERAHLQAVGRDAAGRLQYRYHPEWEKVREAQKGARLAALAAVLPKIRRAVAQHLTGKEPSRNFALAATIELVAGSAIRPGSEEYVKKHGTRGRQRCSNPTSASPATRSPSFSGPKAARTCARSFPRHGSPPQSAPCARSPEHACSNTATSRAPPNGNGARRERILAGDGGYERVAERFPHAMRLGCRTRQPRAYGAGGKSAKARKQVLEAVKKPLRKNSPTRRAVCRRSYVHETVVTAFEKGVLERFFGDAEILPFVRHAASNSWRKSSPPPRCKPRSSTRDGGQSQALHQGAVARFGRIGRREQPRAVENGIRAREKRERLRLVAHAFAPRRKAHHGFGHGDAGGCDDANEIERRERLGLARAACLQRERAR